MKILLSAAFCMLAAAQQPFCDAPHAPDPVAELAAGNRRYAEGKPKHPRQAVECAKGLASGQKPFAVIVACADSRVSPEILFDRGVGDLFVIRLAGNVATADALGSIEYAVDHLDTKLVVVMGHRRCGAVQAAFCPRPGPHIDALWDLIRPSVAHPLEACEHHEQPSAVDWDEAVRNNAVRMTAIVAEDLKKRTGLTIASAYYNLDDGKVEFSKPVK